MEQKIETRECFTCGKQIKPIYGAEKGGFYATLDSKNWYFCSEKCFEDRNKDAKRFREYIDSHGDQFGNFKKETPEEEEQRLERHKEYMKKAVYDYWIRRAKEDLESEEPDDIKIRDHNLTEIEFLEKMGFEGFYDFYMKTETIHSIEDLREWLSKQVIEIVHQRETTETTKEQDKQVTCTCGAKFTPKRRGQVYCTIQCYRKAMTKEP